MNFGQIQMTSDLNYVMANSMNCCVICFSVEAQQNLQLMQTVDPLNAMILTPPYEVVMSPDMNTFTVSYINYLSTDKEAAEWIAIILKAISIGKNILLYLTNDEAQLPYSQVFTTYIYNTFGVRIGSEQIPSSIEPTLIFNAIQYEYLFNLITGDELLDAWKAFKTLPMLSNDTVIKLTGEFNPYGIFNGLEDYYKYFKELCDNDIRLEIAIQKVK